MKINKYANKIIAIVSNGSHVAVTFQISIAFRLSKINSCKIKCFSKMFNTDWVFPVQATPDKHLQLYYNLEIFP